MSNKLPILVSDNLLDTTDAKASIEAVAIDITKDLQDGQYLLAGAKLKMLEEVAKAAKEIIKEKMQEEFDLRSSKVVRVGSIEVRMKSKQDWDYTTCKAWNDTKARLDRIQEKMKICDRAYQDDELKVMINPAAKKDPSTWIEFKMK